MADKDEYQRGFDAGMRHAAALAREGAKEVAKLPTCGGFKGAVVALRALADEFEPPLVAASDAVTGPVHLVTEFMIRRDVVDMSLAENPRAMGFTGDACPDCGGFQMVRNGSCLKCAACGATSGCS